MPFIAGSITGSHCNCKAGREGRCKHVVALLLVHCKNQSAEAEAEEPIAHECEEDSVGRSLPRWIKESSQEVPLNCDAITVVILYTVLYCVFYCRVLLQK